MSIEVVTKEDLETFRMQLVSDIKVLLQSQIAQANNQRVEGYRTKDVRRILGCSVNKLVSLRIARKIRWKKIGGYDLPQQGGGREVAVGRWILIDRAPMLCLATHLLIVMLFLRSMMNFMVYDKYN